MAPRVSARAPAREKPRPSAAPTRPRPGPSAGKLQGVPLASLASCISDREEDALKRRLLAAVRSPDECVSEAGRYRFIETKNLNAFLMWIERSPARGEADRCTELGLALRCVEKRIARRSER